MKSCWLLCHDSYIDHRILFFRDFFKEQDFKTKIFAGNILYNGFFGVDDDDIVRPEISHLIYSFDGEKLIQKGTFDHKKKIVLKLSLRNFLKDLERISTSIANKMSPTLDGHTMIAHHNDRFVVRRKIHLEGLSLEMDSKDSTIKIIQCEESTPVIFKNSDLRKSWEETVSDVYIKKIYNLYPQLRSVLKQIEGFQEDIPDYVYVADLLLVPLGLWIKKNYGSKLIIDCHEWWSEQHKVWIKDDEMAGLIDKFERHYYPQADLCITVGEILAQDMQKHFNKPFYCLRTVGGSVDAVVENRQDYWSTFIKNYNDEKIFLFQGSLTTHRNLDHLARLTRFLKNDEFLVVAGDGPYRGEFLKTIKKEGDQSRLRFLGWQSQERLFKMTIYADVGIVPYCAKNRYLSTAAPNKFFEYLAAKIPIVCDQSMLELSSIVDHYKIGEAVHFNQLSKTAEVLRSLALKQRNLEAKERSRHACRMLGSVEQRKVFSELLQMI